MESKHEALQPIHPSMLEKLDPVFVKLYNDNVANTAVKPIDLAALRKNYSTLYSYGKAPGPDVGRIYDSQILIEGDIKLDTRVYEPDVPCPWPVHVNFHGGGWGLGDLETEAHICKHICSKANVVVVDVAYRLVPEHAFPAAIMDSFGALQYVYQRGRDGFGIDPGRISMGGVSAGGCIALACAHLARDANIPIKLVAAGTPTIDDISKYASAAESPFKSMQENEFAPTLNWPRLKFFDALKKKSITDEQKVGWFLDISKAPNFANLPRTVIYTAGADPLRDEGEHYARLLAENGNEVVLKRYLGVPHPFM